MEIAFDAIGLEISNQTAFNNLAEDAERRGEASCVTRKSGVLHGRCWRLGEGLEVWTVLYESASGEVVHADCRPAFRAQFTQCVSPWISNEFDEEGEALIHGFIEDTDAEVLFELQNLTEVGEKNFQQGTLTIGLCGLAYQAKVVEKNCKPIWKSLVENKRKHENDWSLCGKILAFKTLNNSVSGSTLYWIYLDLGDFRLEILVNQRALNGELKIGESLQAEVWLQGHIVSQSTLRAAYEGVDFSVRPSTYWQKFKKLN
ncbi:MAG: DUF3881 family protein [Pyrinomonadaceae bacterium]